MHERAVSFTKGCYVGQETVARLYYRGKPNRQLRGLRLSAPVEPGELRRLFPEAAEGPDKLARAQLSGEISEGDEVLVDIDDASDALTVRAAAAQTA